MNTRLVIDGTSGTAADWAVLSHLRGWCHDMTLCETCTARREGYADAIRKIAEG